MLKAARFCQRNWGIEFETNTRREPGYERDDERFRRLEGSKMTGFEEIGKTAVFKDMFDLINDTGCLPEEPILSRDAVNVILKTRAGLERCFFGVGATWFKYRTPPRGTEKKEEIR
jgi:hypothetical protein